ncbi:MAG: SRPBCC family protein [bacterium]|nr:SRPBCC family protein [bacterium]
MKLFSLSRTQRLPISVREAWDFFSNPGNLREITPPGLDFVVESELPEQVYPGLIVAYRIRPLVGIPVRWVTEITHVEEPYFFVDEQRFGPYKFWHHEHRFREVDGGTEMEDVVHYGLRFGPFSGLVDRFLVRRKLEAIFDFRYRVMVERFR